jgi:hypothetical protein
MKLKMLATVMDAIAAPVPDKCLAAQDTDWMTFTISLGLAFGIVLSYLPQVPPLTFSNLQAKQTALPHHQP